MAALVWVLTMGEAAEPAGWFLGAWHEDGTPIIETISATGVVEVEAGGHRYVARVVHEGERVGAVLERDGVAHVQPQPVLVDRWWCSSTSNLDTGIRFAVGGGATEADVQEACRGLQAPPPDRFQEVVKRYIAALGTGDRAAAERRLEAPPAGWDEGAEVGRWLGSQVLQISDGVDVAGAGHSVPVTACLREASTGAWHLYTDVARVVSVDHQLRLALAPGPRAGRAPDGIGDSCAEGPSGLGPVDDVVWGGSVQGVALRDGPVPPPPPPSLALRSQVPVEYPEAAKAEGLEARCVARAWVDAAGAPERVEVSGCGASFADAVRRAVMQWRWEPPRADAVPARVTTVVKFVPE